MDTTEPAGTTPAISTALETLTEFDELAYGGDHPGSGWENLTPEELSAWGGRLAMSLRIALLALGQRP